MVSFNTHFSKAQVTIGLIAFFHNFNFDCLVTSLLLKKIRFARIDCTCVKYLLLYLKLGKNTKQTHAILFKFMYALII
jgi:hypothetical protein